MPRPPACPGGLWIEAGRVEYGAALELQHHIVRPKVEKQRDEDVVLVLEHPPVYTLGRRGGRENIRVSGAFLAERGIRIFHAERGGNITYHGPGQLVIYPIMNLEARAMGVADYVAGLETVMVRIAARWGIVAAGNARNRGAWVEDRKLGSIGVTVRRGICFHGLALNVNPSLEPFTWIRPCGLKDVAMTSIETELGQPVKMADAVKTAREAFSDVFNMPLHDADMDALGDPRQAQQAVPSKPAIHG